MQGCSARAARAYRQTQVQSQSPLELVVMLYDGALRFMGLAADALRRGDLLAKREPMSRSLEIISELQSTLNLKDGGEFAARLDGLYSYVTGRLLEANVQGSPAPVEEAIGLLRPLRDAWAQIAAPGGMMSPQERP